MSGGSFENLFIKDADELMRNTEQLERMASQLAALGYAEDAAREAEELLCIIRQARVRIETRQQRLSGVFREMEYWRSCDSNEDDMKAALQRYRGEKT